MSERAVSTVLDATLCLLLVSAAVVALVTVPGGDATGESADVPGDTRAAAGTLAATTATVQRANGTANATVANHLADAALLDASARSEPGFEADVRSATNRTLDGTVGRVGVVALARSGDRTVGRFRVGPTPPPGASVEVSSLSLPATESERADTVVVVVRGWSA